MNFFSGFKTYIVGILIVIFAVCFASNLINADTFLKLIGVLLGLGAMTMRSAVSKLEKKS